jgi:hypothetical protein
MFHASRTAAIDVESKGSISYRSEVGRTGLADNISIDILATVLTDRSMDRRRQVTPK